MKKKENIAIIIVFSIVFFVVFVLNWLTPMLADDYTYTYIFWSQEKISNMKDVWYSMMRHYDIWGGRIFSHGIVYTLSMLPGVVFDILNSAVFILLGYMVFKYINTNSKLNAKMFILIYVVLFLNIPIFGQTSLWAIGSVNYLWTMVIMLMFLYPYYQYVINKKSGLDSKAGVLFALLGFAVGLCNENSSPATILCAILFMGYMIYKKIKIRYWMVLGVVSGIIGWLIMILAPGNAKRSAAVRPGGFSIMHLKDCFMNCIRLLEGEMKYLLIAIIVMFVLAIKYKVDKEKIIIAAIFLIAAMASNFAMTFNVAGYVTRAFIATAIYTTIAGFILFRELKEDWMNNIKIYIYAYMAMVFILQFLYASDSIFTTYVWHNDREAYIQNEVSKGNLNIETYSIKSSNPYSVFYVIEDIGEDETYWTNSIFAQYHGINTVKTNEVKEK